MTNRTNKATNKVDVLLSRIVSEEADPLEIKAPLTPPALSPALNRVQFRGPMGGDFRWEISG